MDARIARSAVFLTAGPGAGHTRAMYAGARVTDAVDFYHRRGEVRGAVRVVRIRRPERLRWRSAVGHLTGVAGRLRGLERMRIEEPIREMVVELPDPDLRREVVLDARRGGVDLDRGEILPVRTMGDVRRFAYLTGTDIDRVTRYVKLPSDFDAPVDAAGVVLVGRAWADTHRRNAQKLWLRLPDPDGPEQWRMHHRIMAERARREAQLSERWAAFARAIVDPTAT